MVRVGTPSAVARPAWYDRTPSTGVQGWVGLGVAPHAGTDRYVYTVPAGKKAIVESFLSRVRRASAATTAGTVTAIIEMRPSGGGFAYMLQTLITTNVVNDQEKDYLTGSVVLLAGDAIAGRTQDGSTGGTVDYYLMSKVTQFDA